MADKLVMGYWDCPFCNTAGIQGTLRACPNCGKPRGEGTKFYMKAQNHEQVVAQGEYLTDAQAQRKGQGEDWKCAYCGGLNSVLDTVCISCGHARDDADETYGEMRERAEAAQVQTTPAVPAARGMSSSMKKMLVLLVAVLAIMGISMFVGAPRSHDFNVTEKTWEYTTEIEEYQYVDENDWTLPSGADLVSTSEEVHHFDQVLDHYETRERTYQERVQSGTHVEYTYEDNGDGTFTEHAHTVPDYTYETRTETYQEPVYVSVPVYRTKYYYKIWRWKYKTTIVNAGDGGVEPSFGDVTSQLADKQRIGRQTQTYWLEGYIDDKADRAGKYEVDADTYNRYAVGDRVPVTTDLTTSHIYEFGA